MSDREIRALDEQTVDRIAAGEVVERPASVVKELVENSLDAGAERIDVTVTEGGTERIRVADDGIGMTQRNLRRAIQQHTTSKLSDVEDLTGGLDTLGFRGEALHTIGAVSHLTITSRPREDDGPGATLTVKGGEVVSTESTGSPPGTIVTVEDLFYNTPAREAFLGAPETEFDHVNRIVTHYALAHPDVAVSLTHGDREIFATSGRGDLKATVLAVWGRDVAASMHAVDHGFEDGPLRRVHGLVSDPETTRSRPRYLSTFVNERYVRSKAIRDGILSGYGGQLAPDRYPFAVLFCTIPPAAVDVNVHPRKMEVRFEEPDIVQDRVETAVRSALLDAGMIRTTAPRGRGAPEETTVQPTLEEEPGEKKPDFSRGQEGNRPSHEPSRPNRSSSSTSKTADGAASFRPSTSQRTFTDDVAAPSLQDLPDLRLLGQLAETYIVAESDDGLVLIDQHAADERIHFEQLRASFREDNTVQTLVRPVDIEVTTDEAEAFDRVREALAELGFEAEATADGVIRVTGVPTILNTSVAPERIRDAVGHAVEATDADSSLSDIAEHVIADMACYPAITGNEPLAEGPMVELLETLDACENPYACPHGRPVLVRIDADELGDRFERDYPGHGSRRPEA